MEYNYFNILPDEIIYIICTYLKSDYIKIYAKDKKHNRLCKTNNRLNNVYLKYINNIKNGDIDGFEKIKRKDLKIEDFRANFDDPGGRQKSLKLYVSISTTNNIVCISSCMIEEIFDYDMLKKRSSDEIVEFQNLYNEILLNIRDMKYIIHFYAYVKGSNFRNECCYININYDIEKNGRINPAYTELREPLISKEWKLIWNKMSNHSNDLLLTHNKYTF